MKFTCGVGLVCATFVNHGTWMRFMASVYQWDVQIIHQLCRLCWMEWKDSTNKIEQILITIIDCWSILPSNGIKMQIRREIGASWKSCTKEMATLSSKSLFSNLKWKNVSSDAFICDIIYARTYLFYIHMCIGCEQLKIKMYINFVIWVIYVVDLNNSYHDS